MRKGIFFLFVCCYILKCLEQFLKHGTYLFKLYFGREDAHHSACRILVPQPGVKPAALAVRARNPNHWTIREFPFSVLLLF